MISSFITFILMHFVWSKVWDKSNQAGTLNQQNKVYYLQALGVGGKGDVCSIINIQLYSSSNSEIVIIQQHNYIIMLSYNPRFDDASSRFQACPSHVTVATTHFSSVFKLWHHQKIMILHYIGRNGHYFHFLQHNWKLSWWITWKLINQISQCPSLCYHYMFATVTVRRILRSGGLYKIANSKRMVWWNVMKFSDGEAFPILYC